MNYSNRTTEDLERIAATLEIVIKSSEERYADARARLDSLRKYLMQDVDAHTDVQAELLARTTSKECNGNT